MEDRQSNSPEAKATIIPRNQIGPRVKTYMGVEEWLESGAWVVVKSKNVASMSYEAGSARLFMRFVKGGFGHYRNVPPNVARDLFLAPSIGKYLDRYIKKGIYVWKAGAVQ